MPWKPNELDPVNGYIMAALQFMRDLPPAGALEVEQLRTKVYGHLSQAANEILNYAYVRTMAETGVYDSPSKQPKVARQAPEKKQAIIDAFQDALRKDLGI